MSHKETRKKSTTTCEIFEKVKCSIKLYLKVPVLYNKGLKIHATFQISENYVNFLK